MLYLFHSSDIILARAKAQALLATLRTKKPDAAFVRFDSENASPDALLELAQTQGLFVQKCIVLLDTLSSAEEPEAFWETLGTLASSENIFILVEKTPKKDLLTCFEKVATEVREIAVRGARAPARAPQRARRKTRLLSPMHFLKKMAQDCGRYICIFLVRVSYLSRFSVRSFGR